LSALGRNRTTLRQRCRRCDINDTLTYCEPTASRQVAEALDIAVRVHKALGLQDYSRCDFRLARNGTVFCMEVSTHPDIDPESSFACAGRKVLRDYPSVIQAIVEAAASRIERTCDESHVLQNPT